MRDKEIFKKQKLPMSELDADSFDGVNETKNVNLAKVKKHTRKHYRRSLRKHNNHYLYQLSGETFPHVEKMHKRKSIISKNRITRSIGIYNKGKKSETICREQRKSRLFNKVSDGLKEKTSKDISKVLDCSSFQIKPFPVASKDNTMHDLNNQDNNSDFSSFYSEQVNQIGRRCTPEKNEIHLFEASPATRDQVTNNDLSSLPIETPLEDIKQNIMNRMRPLQTFKRDYLQEIIGELQEYYRKSSSLNRCESAEHQSTATSTSVTPRSTSKIISTEGNISSIRKIECMGRLNVHTGIHQGRISEEDKTLMETEKVQMENNKQLQTFSQSSPTVSRCMDSDQRISVDNITHGNIDILSMLMDEDLRYTDEVDLIGIQSPVYSNISPLKKPSLEIPSPPGKLFPRKLF